VTNQIAEVLKCMPRFLVAVDGFVNIGNGACPVRRLFRLRGGKLPFR
jgi:hypothetical protein